MRRYIVPGLSVRVALSVCVFVYANSEFTFSKGHPPLFLQVVKYLCNNFTFFSVQSVVPYPCHTTHRIVRVCRALQNAQKPLCRATQCQWSVKTGVTAYLKFLAQTQSSWTGGSSELCCPPGQEDFFWNYLDTVLLLTLDLHVPPAQFLIGGNLNAWDVSLSYMSTAGWL